VSFDAITLCVASQQVIPKVSVYFVTTQSGKLWIHPRTWEDNIKRGLQEIGCEDLNCIQLD
jgi:hypothetical protein